MSAAPSNPPKASVRRVKQARTGRGTAQAILNGFKGPAPRVKTSFFYKLGMLVIAGAMLLLPVAYFGLMCLIGYGIYYHAVEHTGMLSMDHVRGRALVWMLVAYSAPLFAGVVLILFMIKPLFARSRQDYDPLTLDISQEPLLFAFIEKLCTVMGAPKPRRIEVNCEVNAAAGYGRGLLSLFSPNMALLIGLPLAAGMSLNQFVSVLAHEFGHFSQGSAMRLSYIVDSINRWFARAVYQRDNWDAWLEDLSQEESSAVKLAAGLTRILVWLTRRILWCFMMLGKSISSAMARQMEYDADRRAAAVVGSETAVAALRRGPVLSDAFSESLRDLRLSWEQRKLVDNLPAMIASKAERLSANEAARIIDDRAKERAGLFSSHPAFARRQTSIANYAADGVFDVEVPATALFANFKMIANAVSLTLYRHHIGLKVENKNLIPVEQIIGEHDRVREEQAALPRYFQNSIDSYEPLFLGVSRITTPANPRETLARLKAARHRFERAAPTYRKLADQIDAERKKIMEATTGRLAIRAGFRLRPGMFGLDKPTVECAEATIRQGERAVQHGMAKLEGYYKLLRVRLLSAMELARVPEIRKRLKPELTNDEEIDRVLAALESLERANNIRIRIAPWQDGLTRLFATDEGEEMHEAYPMLPAVERSTADRIYGMMLDLRSVLGDAKYPFERADGEITISEYITPKAPNPRNPLSVNTTCEHLLDRSGILYALCMARLVRLAEAVERIAGMPPLSTPEPSESDASSESAQ